MKPILFGVAVMIAVSLLQRRRLERLLRRARERYRATRPPAATLARLDDLSQVAIQALVQRLVEPPDVEDVVLQGEDDAARLRSATVLCARRFGLDPEILLVSFADLPAGRGADVAWSTVPQAVVGGDGIELKYADSQRFRVRVDNAARASDALLTAHMAHELAHIALKQQGVWLDNEADNELLTEAAAVLAGFGPLMRSTAYMEDRHYVLGGRMEVTWGTAGYLHEESIDRLMAKRASLRRGRTKTPYRRHLTRS